ncbi:hypothetical protein BDQ94DRAFT_169338 [Aspergillus welwitschiae]|uniref:Uncharacterized protein n=1 Tax=Aspergillus welwitschiae TaxID=1341132 RepID=A0A3F3Q5A5_9EURO|nr:hypothetical protein BDQ94DRAFT_169338 [Aspergillus welwitschiae]RDH34380.1 hypothetical protein BDQ94DRAFT_169338 [Aspergillus welwitschiae]
MAQKRPSSDNQASDSKGRQVEDNHGLVQHCDRLEDLSNSLHQELSTLRRVSIRKQNSIDSLQQKLSELRHQNQELEEQLQECQARILKLTFANDLSDTTVIQEFVRIRDNLSNWCEGLPDIIYYSDSDLRGALEGFKCCLQITQDLDTHAQMLLEAQSELLMHITFCRLWRGFLQTLIPGISSSDEALLRELYAGLLSQQSGEDSESAKIWKWSTRRAYVACQRYEKRMNEECINIIDDLHNLFSWFDFGGQVNWANKMARFIEDILKPVVGLVTQISNSSAYYGWQWYGEAFFPERVVRKYHLEQFIVQDSRTHHRIRVANFESLPDETPVGELLIVIFPALFRCANNGHEHLLLEKAVILTRVVEEVPSQKISEKRS